MASPLQDSIRQQKRLQQRERARHLCALGIYTVFLTPALLGLIAISLFGLPGASRTDTASQANQEPWPPIGTAASAAAIEARASDGARLKIVRFAPGDPSTAGRVHKFTAADVHASRSEADRARDFILSLGADEAIAPRDLAKNLRCAQTAVLEAASQLDAYISLSIDGQVGSFIAHPQIVARYRANSGSDPSAWAGNPAEGDLSLPAPDPATPGELLSVPAEFPALPPR